MSLHDRDYVRNKNFDYKKMEYSADSISYKSASVDNDLSVHVPIHSKTITKIFFFVFFMFGFLIAIKIF